MVRMKKGISKKKEGNTNKGSRGAKRKVKAVVICKAASWTTWTIN